MKFYRLEDCFLCQGTGIIEINPDHERTEESLKLYIHVDADFCPACDGNCEIRVYTKVKNGK